MILSCIILKNCILSMTVSKFIETSLKIESNLIVAVKSIQFYFKLSPINSTLARRLFEQIKKNRYFSVIFEMDRSLAYY